MKMIYLANVRIPTEKAHGVQIMKMCQAFQKAGLDIELVVAKRSNPQFKNISPFDYYGISQKFPIKKLWLVDVVGWRFLGVFSVLIPNITFALSAFFHLLFKKADIIYSRDEFSLFFLSFFKKNLVLELHTFPNSKLFLYKWLFKRIKKIVVINNRLKQVVVDLGIEPDKILVAHDGVDLEQFIIKESKEECRRKLNFSLDKKIVIYTGQLFKWKGVYILAEASKFLDDNFRIILVGGMKKDIVKLEEFIQKENLGKVIILGHQILDSIPFYLKSADVLVLPNSAKERISREWTSPMKMFEYMASQRPIVASDLPSLREILNENNAILVKPDDIQDLANGINQSLKNPDFSAKMSKQAFKNVQNYTWMKRAKKILDFLNND
ncbi:MAG: glycosyltransferase family 4 protein [Patescibacteria group bacterium]